MVLTDIMHARTTTRGIQPNSCIYVTLVSLIMSYSRIIIYPTDDDTLI